MCHHACLDLHFLHSAVVAFGHFSSVSFSYHRLVHFENLSTSGCSCIHLFTIGAFRRRDVIVSFGILMPTHKAFKQANETQV